MNWRDFLLKYQQYEDSVILESILKSIKSADGTSTIAELALALARKIVYRPDSQLIDDEVVDCPDCEYVGPNNGYQRAPDEPAECSTCNDTGKVRKHLRQPT